eukprot:scaffold6683_cov264-Chaetoceros_neogracile.AAC.2
MTWTSITENERESISRLRERLSSHFSTDGRHGPDDDNCVMVGPHTFRDIVLLRFLRGRDHVEHDAFDLLVEYATWRITYDVDLALTDSFVLQRISTEQQKKKYEIVSEADLGDRPAAFVFVGKHYKYERDLGEMRYLIIHVLERLVALAKPDQERDYEVAQILVYILKTYYPETLEHIIFVDSPWIFSACWTIIKQWLTPVTLEKVLFLTKSDLSKYVRSEAIPKGFAEEDDDDNQ